AKAIQSAPNAVLATKISSSQTGSLWMDPLPSFLQAAKGFGHVQAIIDFDGICRSIPPQEPSADGLRPSFAFKLASLLQRSPDSGGVHAEAPGVERLRAAAPFLIDYRHQYEPGQERPPFAVVSAAELLGGKASPELAGKAVLIGFGSIEVSDRLVTPVSNQLPMPGVEINANVLEMLLSGASVARLGTPWQLLLLVVISAISVWLVVRMPGVR